MAQAGMLVYVAGFFDGEGAIYIDKTKCAENRTGVRYQLNWTVHNTNAEVLRKIHEFLGKEGIHLTVDKRNRGKYPDVYYIAAESRKAAVIIRMLRPLLIVKKRQADLALKFQARMKVGAKNLCAEEWSFREKCYREMRKLNGGGKS